MSKPVEIHARQLNRNEDSFEDRHFIQIYVGNPENNIPPDWRTEDAGEGYGRYISTRVLEPLPVTDQELTLMLNVLWEGFVTPGGFGELHKQINGEEDLGFMSDHSILNEISKRFAKNK